MTVTRAPILGVTIAALLLLAESLGLAGYQQHQRERAVDAKALKAREQAVEDAIQARAKLDALIAELDRLDGEIRRLSLPKCHPLHEQRVRALRELKRVRIEQRELYDMLRPVDPSRVGG